MHVQYILHAQGLNIRIWSQQECVGSDTCLGIATFALLQQIKVKRREENERHSSSRRTQESGAIDQPDWRVDSR